MITNRSVSLSDQIFDKLENDILTGDIPRDSIITETQISEKLGVSRTPVREALLRLQQEHMLEDTGKGIRVLGITKDDAECIYEIRERIEGLAAANAAKNASPEILAKMKEAVDMQMYFIQKKDIDKIREMDSKFHELMYIASGNPVLCDTLNTLHKKIQKYRTVSVSHKGRAELSVNEHSAIYEAIAKGDAKAAEKAAAYHVGQAKNSVLKES